MTMRSLLKLRRLALLMLASVLSAADLTNLTGVTWIVKGILPAGVVACVFGPSGGGKTFWVLDLMLRVASGMSWYGRKTQSGYVLMLAGEGAQGIKKRVDAFLQHHGRDYSDLAFGLRPDVIDLTDRKQVAALAIAARMAARRSGKRLAIIGIDTFSRATRNADENSNTAMALVMENCTWLSKATGATVLPIHHSGHSGERARGASSIKGALDCEISVFPEDNGLTMSVSKQKEGEEIEGLRFKKIVVPLGVDADGDPITSLVLELDEAPAVLDISRVRNDAAAMLSALERSESGLTDTSWRAACAIAGCDFNKQKWYKLRGLLIDQKMVVKEDRLFKISPAVAPVAAAA